MKWIEIRNQMPTVCDDVLICTDEGHVSTGHLSKRYENLWVIHNQEFSDEKVVAWQPLPAPFKYSSGVECKQTNEKIRSDFTKEEQDIGDLAYVECMEKIKKVINEYLTKDEILQEVWGALNHGIKDFLGDYSEYIIEKLVKEFNTNLRIDVNFNHGNRNA